MKTHNLSQYKFADRVSIHGEGRVESVKFFRGNKEYEIETQSVFIHQGLVPNIHLSLQANCEKTYCKFAKVFNISVDDFGKSSVDNIFALAMVKTQRIDSLIEPSIFVCFTN